MLYQSWDYVFSAWFSLNEVDSEATLLKVFVLIEKYYPNYSFQFDDFIRQKKKWIDYVLWDFVFTPKRFNNIYFAVNVYVQEPGGTVIMMEPQDDCLEIIYGSDDGNPVLGVQFYPYIYFDKNIIYRDGPEDMLERREIIDQAIAAKNNREILSAFLRELEKMIGSEITYFEGSRSFSEEYVFKYGIKEDVKLYELEE